MSPWTAQVGAERKTECLVKGHGFQEREEPTASSTGLGLAPGWAAESQLLNPQTSGAQISAQKGEKPQVMENLRGQDEIRYLLMCSSVPVWAQCCGPEW